MSLPSAPHIATAEIAPAGMRWPKFIGYMLWCMLEPTRHDKAALLPQSRRTCLKPDCLSAEEYKCGKARLFSMLEDSDDPVVKTVQPSIKTGRKWKAVTAVDQAKECLKIKEVIGQTQTDRKGLGSSTTKWWSKAEGKEKRDMVINEIRLNEDSRKTQKAVQQRQQGQWTNWDNVLQKSLSWNDIWHMAPLRISFLIRSVYDLLPSNANLV
ncbi:hypothetical protein EGW08_011865 [Elysia chlorotica]|uniref:Uncharacterized protein n=1 Tax=Elysia chlorotica TaxID=188477 RepID=A0A433TFJ9_ELYCH|nr:hypothetical protein EGW08_011865 [Elysia chlorotica]